MDLPVSPCEPHGGDGNDPGPLPVSQDTNRGFDVQQTSGERAADRAAEFGGSSVAIGLFPAVMAFWMAPHHDLRRPFDPYAASTRRSTP
jgi:hypothetical protein